MRPWPQSVQEVAQWLRDKGLERHAEAFVQSSVDGAVLLALDDEVLRDELGVDARLDRIKILNAVARMRELAQKDAAAADVEGAGGGGGRMPPLQSPWPLRPLQSRSPEPHMGPVSVGRHRHRRSLSNCSNSGPLARASMDFADGDLRGADDALPHLTSEGRRQSCSDLPRAPIPPTGTARRSVDGRSASPEMLRALARASSDGYTAHGLPSGGSQKGARLLQRSESMNSSRPSMASSRMLRLHRSTSFASQVTTSSSSSTSGELLSFRRFKRFCATTGLDVSVETLEIVTGWSIPELFSALLRGSVKLQEDAANLAECEAMARMCANNLKQEAYLSVGDLIDDLDVQDFRHDLQSYGLRKKRLLNELCGLLEEMRTFHAVHAPNSPGQGSFWNPASSPAATDGTETPYESPGQRRGGSGGLPLLRQRSASTGAIDLDSDGTDGPVPEGFGLSPPARMSSAAGFRAVALGSKTSLRQRQGRGRPHASLRAVARGLRSPQSDEVSGFLEQGFTTSGDEASLESPAGMTTSQRRKRNGGSNSDAAGLDVPRCVALGLPPTTPPGKAPVLKQRHTDKPAARSSRGGCKSRPRQEVAQKGSKAMGNGSFESPVARNESKVPKNGARWQRRRARILTEPLPQNSGILGPPEKLTFKETTRRALGDMDEYAADCSVRRQRLTRGTSDVGARERLRLDARELSLDEDEEERQDVETDEDEQDYYDETVETGEPSLLQSESKAEAPKYKKAAFKLSIDVGQEGKGSPPAGLASDSENTNTANRKNCKGLQAPKIEIPLPAAHGSGQQSRSSRLRQGLGVDIGAIEKEIALDSSIVVMDNGNLHYGHLVIGEGGVKGAPGVRALDRDARQDAAKLFRGPKGAFKAVVKSGTHRRVKMRSGLRLIGHLGKGAGGTVLKAIHVPTLRVVAVKEVVVNDKSQRKQMRRELDTLLYGLQHPNVVRFYDSFFNPQAGTTSMVFEFLSGGSLQDLVDKKVPAPDTTMRRIALGCLRGLEYLHKLNLLHRDIKPSNLLLTRSGAVKIADFGISRDLEGSQAQCNTYLGTCMYMSPERILGNEYSYKADVWSLGMSLLTCALGHFPFQVGSGYWGLNEAILKKPFPKLPGSFCEELAKMISLCLERDPEERVATSALLKSDYFVRAGKQEDARQEAFEREPPPEDDGRQLKQCDPKRLEELDKIVLDVTSHFRDQYTQSSESPGQLDSTFTVKLELDQLRALADQLDLPRHKVIGVMDQGLRKLEAELTAAKESF